MAERKKIPPHARFEGLERYGNEKTLVCYIDHKLALKQGCSLVIRLSAMITSKSKAQLAAKGTGSSVEPNRIGRGGGDNTSDETIQSGIRVDMGHIVPTK